ncbi:MAG: YitT family protein, partial [Pyrinomonadaceae bacterium]|nr:YitT family protein [Pyrinomonadaceae bacterium]
MNMLLVEAKNALLIIAGIFLAAFGLKGFLLSSGFIDGGVTGVSML